MFMEGTDRKKATGAGNQQERLVGLKHWIRGFVDGEGCFSIGFVVQPGSPDPSRPQGKRFGYKTGYQIAHSFDVVQGERSLESLKIIQNFFNVGNIYPNRRHDNHKEDLYRYVVRKRDELLNVIIPFFEQNSLLTAKQEDFKRFATILRMMDRKEHLDWKGLVKIARIAQEMNHRKPRKNLIRILRDHTPGAQAVSTKKLQA